MLPSAVWWRSLAPWVLLTLLVVALRAPGFVWEVLNIDESDSYLYGQSLAEGGQAYISFVEKKPPFVYGFFAALIGVGAEDLRLIRVVTAFWVLLGCMVVRHTALLAGLGPRAAWLGAFVFGAFSSNITVATDCETLMNLPVVCAAWLTLRGLHEPGSASLRRICFDGLAGAAAAVAVGFKHQAAMALIALVGFHITRKGTRRRASLIATVVGFALVVGVSSSWFWATGRWEPFLEWNVTRNLAYTREASPFDWTRLVVAVGLYGLANGVVFLGMGVSVLRALVGRRRLVLTHSSGSDETMALLALWLYGTAWMGVVAGGRFYTHYFLQLVPGAALLAAAFWHLSTNAAMAAQWRFVAVGLLCAAAAGFGGNTWARGLFKKNFPSQDPQAVEIAKWLREHTTSTDRVYVWGYFNPVYYLAQRRPASRFVNPSPIVGDFDPLHIPPDFDARPFVRADDAEVLIQDIEATSCAVFVDTAPSDLHGWSRFPLAAVPTLDRYVRKAYVVETVVAGAAIYRRQPQATASHPVSNGK